MIPRRTAVAFTLVEMVMSLAIVSVLMAATTSAIIIAGRAMPDRKDVSTLVMEAAKRWQQIESELRYATAVTELSATAVTFKVADRNGDTTEETIRYSWSGVAGAPLARQYNAEAAVAVLDDVREFQIAYDRYRETLPTSYAVSAEQTLYSNTSYILAETFGVDDDEWPGQYFMPTLPANAAWWRVTRISVQARKDDDPGETRVQIRGADGSNRPTVAVYDQASMTAGVLSSSYQWREVLLTRDARLTPGHGACVVFQWVRGDDASDLRVGTGLVSGMVQTTNSGTSWSSPLLKSMLIQVYGVVATPNSPEYRYTLTDIRMVVRSGSDAAARYSAGVRLVNTPQVVTP